MESPVAVLTCHLMLHSHATRKGSALSKHHLLCLHFGSSCHHLLFLHRGISSSYLPPLCCWKLFICILWLRMMLPSSKPEGSHLSKLFMEWSVILFLIPTLLSLTSVYPASLCVWLWWTLAFLSSWGVASFFHFLRPAWFCDSSLHSSIPDAEPLKTYTPLSSWYYPFLFLLRILIQFENMSLFPHCNTS